MVNLFVNTTARGINGGSVCRHYCSVLDLFAVRVTARGINVGPVCRQGYCSGYQRWTCLPSGLLLGASVLDLFAVITAQGVNVD